MLDSLNIPTIIWFSLNWGDIQAGAGKGSPEIRYSASFNQDRSLFCSAFNLLLFQQWFQEIKGYKYKTMAYFPTSSNSYLLKRGEEQCGNLIWKGGANIRPWGKLLQVKILRKVRCRKSRWRAVKIFIISIEAFNNVELHLLKSNMDNSRGHNLVSHLN